MTITDETVAKRATRAAFATRLLVILVALFVAFQGYGVYLIFDLTSGIERTVTEVRQTQKSSRSIIEKLNDCTKPRGECYQASEARDAKQQGAFNATVLAAAWCINQDPPSHRALRQCVAEILDKKGSHS